MEDYQKNRQRRIAALMEELRAQARMHERKKTSIREKYQELTSAIKNAKDCRGHLRMLDREISSIRDYMNHMGEFPEDYLDKVANRKLRIPSKSESKKAGNRSLRISEITINSIVFDVSNSLRGLRRSIESSLPFIENMQIARETRDLVYEQERALEFEGKPDIAKFYSHIPFCELNLTGALPGFLSFLDNYKPPTTEKLKIAARENVRVLCGLSEEKHKLIGSLEEKVIKYSTAVAEIRRIEDSGNTEEIEYLEFLERKANESLQYLENNEFDSVKDSLDKIASKGIIGEDDYPFVLAKIKNIYHKVSQSAESAPRSLEDTRLRALVLQSDFGIPLAASFARAKIMEDDDIARVYSRLSEILEPRKAKLLLRENPDLFLLDNGRLDRYLDSLEEVIDYAEEYSEIKDFSLENNPSSFSSFEALHQTAYKMRNLEDKFLGNKPQEGIKVMISKKALERARKDSYIAENKERYLREICMLSHNPLGRTKRERIGDFNVSPMGRSKKGFRVAWHFDGTSKTLFIDDLLYHTQQYSYVDNWNDRASNGKDINQSYYQKQGYKRFQGEI